MAFIVPDYIGFPGSQFDHDGGSKVYDRTLETMQLAFIKPLDTEITKSINIYRGKNAWGEYTSYLEKNGVEPPANPPKAGHIAVLCNNITPISESYSNDYAPSEIMSGIQNIASSGLQEASFMSGGLSADQLSQSDNKFVSGAGELWGKGAEAVGDLVKSFAGNENGQDVQHLLSHPCEKIDIPTMWKGNGFQAQYELSIRLYCFNATDDKVYGSNILASLCALMQFVCPRSEGGKFYKWPFMMDFEIPGLVHLPLAYCSNLTVVKGGDVNDISWKYRPNMIDLRMSINTVYGVTVNALDEGNSGDHPTIKKELAALFKIKGSASDAANALNGIADEIDTSSIDMSAFEEATRTKNQSIDSKAAEAALT